MTNILDGLAKPPPPLSELDEPDIRYAQWLLSKATPNGECLDCHFIPKNTGYCKIAGGDSAHRFVCHILKQKVPDDKIVMHTCDNRRCIRLEHLVIGSHGDNTADMFAKGRYRVGYHSTEPNNNLKVVTAVVFEEIKEMYQCGSSQREIARAFGISQTTVRMYLNGTRTAV